MTEDKKPLLGLEVMTVNDVTGVKRGQMMSAMVPVSKLTPTSSNPNQMDEKEFELLKETITENGFLDPLQVIPLESGQFAINGGEHRWKAAVDLGIKELPCEILYEDRWKDEELQEFQMVRFNVLHGKMNPEKFVNIYKKVVAKYGQDKVSKLMGYTNNLGVSKMIKQVSQQIRDTLPAEVAKRFDEQAKEAKTAGDLNKIIRHIFDEHGDTAKYSYMVFSFAGKEHVYVALNKEEHDQLKKMLELAKGQKIDANNLFGTAFTNMLNQLEDGREKDN